MICWPLHALLIQYVQESVGVSEEDKELKIRSMMEEDVLGGEAARETCLMEEHAETNSNLTLSVSRIYIAAAEDNSSSEGTEFSKKGTFTQTT